MSLDLEVIRQSYSGENWRESIDPDIRILIGLLNLLPGCATVCSCASSGVRMERIVDSFVPSVHSLDEGNSRPYISVVCEDPLSAAVLGMSVIGLPISFQFGEGMIPLGEKIDHLASLHFFNINVLRLFSRSIWILSRQLSNNFLNIQYEAA